ncbi:MAG: CcmD family protein [Desulfovibrio sp.]|jgi:CcmD family protein|nr:CcmD family protein [Desulfovibrio sp.]
MDSYEWIMYASLVIWIGIGLYLCVLGRKQALLSRRIKRMTELAKDGE